MPLELKLVKPLIVKGAEFRVNPRRVRIIPTCGAEEVNDEAEPRPLGKRETLLGFRLRPRQEDLLLSGSS